MKRKIRYNKTVTFRCSDEHIRMIEELRDKNNYNTGELIRVFIIDNYKKINETK